VAAALRLLFSRSQRHMTRLMLLLICLTLCLLQVMWQTQQQLLRLHCGCCLPASCVWCGCQAITRRGCGLAAGTLSCTQTHSLNCWRCGRWDNCCLPLKRVSLLPKRSLVICLCAMQVDLHGTNTSVVVDWSPVEPLTTVAVTIDAVGGCAMLGVHMTCCCHPCCCCHACCCHTCCRWLTSAV
jgi:hypothetical protein